MRSGRYGLALVATLAVHAAAATALVAVRPGDDPERLEVVAEIEMDVVAPEPEPPPEPPPPEPEPAPGPDKAPEPEKAEKPEKPDKPEPRPAPPPEPEPPRPGDTGEPAPGWATDPPNADQPYDLGAAVPAAEARAPGARGRGGTGGGHGLGAGGTDGTGSAPTPVSVSEIKTMPQPIGDTDFVEAHRDYPAEARRLGIDGQVKVRLVVDAEGRVATRRLVTRLGHGLDELAMRLAGKLRFRPAIDNHDRPVPAVVVWTFTFTLPR
ncbi:MAG TPA: TonB family protein [Kofleriaceae bacterium]|nr:TonB family protein [Kofleriaceae bacterium]